MFRNKTFKILSCLILLTLIFYTKLITQNGSYLIKSHHAFIKILPQLQKLEISDTINITVDNPTKSLVFKLNPLFNIEVINYKNRKLSFQKNNELLKIAENFSGSFEVIIKYSGYFYNRTEFSKLDSSFAILHEMDIFPQGTKSYEYSRLTIQAPKNWKIITAGVEVIRFLNNDSITYVFENAQPVETLGWICGGIFLSHYVSDDQNNFGVHTIDTINTNAINEIVNISQRAISFYSNLFSKYRFSKLDIVEIEDWVATSPVLAIAYPSVILVKKRAFKTKDEYDYVTSILPHEIAHQWFPLTNFTEDVDLPFLSEGLCEYSAILFYEKQNKKSLKTELNNHPLMRSLILKSQRDEGVPLKQKIDMRKMPTHYLKASYVHHMLRSYLGDTIYLNILKKYSNEFFLKKSNSKIFQEIAETLSGKKLNWFFSQWLEQTGIPRFKIYGIKSELKSDSLWYTEGRARFISYKEKFTGPIEVVATTKNKKEKKIIWLGYDEEQKYSNEGKFIFITKWKPDSIILDPEGKILKWKKVPVMLSDLRDPADGIMIVGSNTKAERNIQLLNIAKRDSAEMIKVGWNLKIIFDTSATLETLQSYNIFLYGNNNENKVLQLVRSKFPIQPESQSVKIDDVVYSENFTLIQAIENPYRVDGIICWILPFSEKSDPILLPYQASYVIIENSQIIKKGISDITNPDLFVEVR